MKELVFATHNKNKLKEVQEFLGSEFKVLGLEAIGITADIPEPAETLEGNSEIKARYVYERKGIPCFAEDSGIFIKALQNRPGVFSARYDGPDGDPVQKVLVEMEGQEDRMADFIVCLTYIDSFGVSHKIIGNVKGTIITEKRGTQGWLYDMVFVPEGYSETYAEMGPERKQQVSPRVKALMELKNYLREV